MVTPRKTFRKHERLTGRDAINALMKEGSAMNDRPLRVVGFLTPAPDGAPARVAFAIPKRHVRSAVDRNRIRRRMREAYRLEKDRWYQALNNAGTRCVWLFIWQSAEIPAYKGVHSKLVRLADRWLRTNLHKGSA